MLNTIVIKINFVYYKNVNSISNSEVMGTIAKE